MQAQRLGVRDELDWLSPKAHADAAGPPPSDPFDALEPFGHRTWGASGSGVGAGAPFAGMYDCAPVQRVASGTGVSSPLDLGQLIPSGGQSMEPVVQRKMESALGADFSGVRVHHDDRRAAAMGAEAYTVGQDVVFKSGNYDPGSEAGQHRLAHELTHVVQQRAGAVSGTDLGNGVAVSDPGDSFERDAESAADRAMGGAPPATISSGGSSGGGGGSVQRVVQREASGDDDSVGRDRQLDGGAGEVHGAAPEETPRPVPAPDPNDPAQIAARAESDKAADEFSAKVSGDADRDSTQVQAEKEEKEDMANATRAHTSADMEANAKDQYRGIQDQEANLRKAQIAADLANSKVEPNMIGGRTNAVEGLVKLSPGQSFNGRLQEATAKADAAAANDTAAVEQQTLQRKQTEIDKDLAEKGVKKRGLSPIESN